jgi:anti-sigma factor RsiW
MIAYLGCDAARGMLHEFVDRELPIADQVAVEAHLRWCDTCRAHVEDLGYIGGLLRRRAAVLIGATDEAPALAVMQSEVVARIDAEHEQSLPVRTREMLKDMRLFWPALGATTALLICLSAVTGVSNILRGVRPDSMAALISLLANPGSDENPLVLDERMLAPRTLDIGSGLASLCGDAEFAVAAVVTREGRVSNYSLLQTPHERPGRRDGASHVDDMSALSDAVRQSRFTPAQTPDGAVAVNVVWLLARTTVKPSQATGEIGPLPRRATAREHASTRGLNGSPAPPVLRPARS